MKIQTVFTRSLLATAMLAVSSAALAELSANIAATSNYVWRGVSQTDDQAAVQGGIDWSPDNSGFYAGSWASNVDFGSTSTTTSDGNNNFTTETDHDTGFELDLYAGYAGELGEFGYDVGAIGYVYTSSAGANFWELAASGSWRFITIGYNYTVDGEADSSTDAFVEDDYYYYLSLGTALPQGFGVSATAGHYEFENVSGYNHYQLDITKDAGDFGEFTLTGYKAESSAGGTNGNDIQAVVSWGKTFD